MQLPLLEATTIAIGMGVPALCWQMSSLCADTSQYNLLNMQMGAWKRYIYANTILRYLQWNRSTSGNAYSPESVGTEGGESQHAADDSAHARAFNMNLAVTVKRRKKEDVSQLTVKESCW